MPPRMFPIAMPQVVRERRARGDRDLRQVRRDREEDETADGLADAEPVVEHVRRRREMNARDPHGRRACGEDEQQKPERHAAVAFVA